MIDNFEEKPKLSAEGHVLIRDVDSSEILLDKYNAINFVNLSFAIANLLSGDSTHIINSMHFGNGGSTINTQGLVEYNNPKVDGGTGNRLYQVDNVYPKPIPSGAFTVSPRTTDPFSDLVIKVTLDYGEPADASETDTSVDFEDPTDYVFDELGLVTASGDFLTHLIFHPIQKSKNRKLEIIYTLRIRAGV